MSFATASLTIGKEAIVEAVENRVSNRLPNASVEFVLSQHVVAGFLLGSKSPG